MSTDAGKMRMNLDNVPSSSSPPRTLSMAVGGRDKDHQQEEHDDALAVAAPSTDAYQCSICLDVASLRPVVTSCGHLFCGTCLEEWTGRQKKSCPVCKGSLSQQSTVAISSLPAGRTVTTSLPIAAHDASSSSAALFQCQLCAHTATAPVLLTSCGHLFCWTCLCLSHRNEAVYSHSCTACGTSFAEEHVIPIYVKGEADDQHRGDRPTPSGANEDLPCRPPAQRRTEHVDDDDGYPMQQHDLPAPPPSPPQGEITLGELLQFLGWSNGTTAAMRTMMRLTTLQSSSTSSHSHSHSQSEERPNKRLRSN